MDPKQNYIKYKIMYGGLVKKINQYNIDNNKINNGNINMGEDYIFEQTNTITSMKGRTSLSLGQAISELNRYFDNK